MKNLALALALVGLTVGCAEEAAEPAEPVVTDAQVVTEPADDLMMETDSTMMEEGEMTDEGDGAAVEEMEEGTE